MDDILCAYGRMSECACGERQAEPNEFFCGWLKRLIGIRSTLRLCICITWLCASKSVRPRSYRLCFHTVKMFRHVGIIRNNIARKMVMMSAEIFAVGLY